MRRLHALPQEITYPILSDGEKLSLSYFYAKYKDEYSLRVARENNAAYYSQGGSWWVFHNIENWNPYSRYLSHEQTVERLIGERHTWKPFDWSMAEIVDTLEGAR